MPPIRTLLLKIFVNIIRILILFPVPPGIFDRFWNLDLSLLQIFFRMKNFLPEYKATKLLLDSAHDAMPYYEYFRREGIIPFIDLNEKGGVKLPYKNDFTIGKDGVPVCRAGRRMNHDGY